MLKIRLMFFLGLVLCTPSQAFTTPHCLNPNSFCLFVIKDESMPVKQNMAVVYHIKSFDPPNFESNWKQLSKTSIETQIMEYSPSVFHNIVIQLDRIVIPPNTIDVKRCQIKFDNEMQAGTYIFKLKNINENIDCSLIR